MDGEEATKLLEVHRELEDAMSMKVKITHAQVTYITASDLLSKYKRLLELSRGDDDKDIQAFKRVLEGWYFTPEELKSVLELKDNA